MDPVKITSLSQVDFIAVLRYSVTRETSVARMGLAVQCSPLYGLFYVFAP